MLTRLADGLFLPYEEHADKGYENGPLCYSQLSNDKPLFLLGLNCFKRGAQKKTMKIGYARVSTDEQNLDLQRRALEAAGCEQIFEDYGVGFLQNPDDL